MIDADNKRTLFAIQGDLDGEKPEAVDTEQFLGVIVGPEDFFIPVAIVREIIMLQKLTYVPLSDKHVEGVLNLRGTVLPILNLSKLMGNMRSEASSAARIVIAAHLNHMVGLIVDGVSVVSTLAADAIDHQAFMENDKSFRLVSRIANYDGKLRGILDLNRIVQSIMPQESVQTSLETV